MSEFTTSDPEEARAFLSGAYVDNVMRIHGRTDGFRMAHTRRDAGPFSSSTLAHTMSVEHVVPPLGYVLVARVLAGRIESEISGETFRAVRGDVFMASPDRPYAVRWPGSPRRVWTSRSACTWARPRPATWRTPGRGTSAPEFRVESGWFPMARTSSSAYGLGGNRFGGER